MSTIIQNSGQLSKIDIQKELHEKNGISIFSCVDIDKNLFASSIDITPTIVCMSVKSGMLQNVYVKKSQTTNSYYVYVRPQDTLLIISNEFISLPNYISGYVTSRVSNIANGFGHICTTIDPNWKGALLIGLSNPTNRIIKIDVGTSTRYNSGNDAVYNPSKKPLATLTFNYLATPLTENESTHSSMRIDLLKKVSYIEKRGVKSFVRAVFHPNRKKFTDYFFEYLEVNEDKLKTEKGWKEFLEEFSIFQKTNSSADGNSRYCKCADDFVIKENILNRGKHFFEDHKILFAVIVLIILFTVCEVYPSFKDILSNFWDFFKIFKG